MTSITVSEVNWGERRAAERGARQRQRARWIVASAVLITVGGSFLAGLIDGFTHGTSMLRHEALIHVAIALLFVPVAGWLAWRNWTERDEVERRIALNTWAAIGMAAVALHPLLRAAQPLLHLADPAESAWLGALAVGAATMLFQKVRP